MLRFLLGLEPAESKFNTADVPDCVPQRKRDWVEGYETYKDRILRILDEIGWRLVVTDDEDFWRTESNPNRERGDEIYDVVSAGFTDVDEKAICIRRKYLNRRGTEFLHEVVHVMQFENGTNPLFDPAKMRRKAAQVDPEIAELDPFEREAHYLSECGWEVVYLLLKQFV